MYIFRTSQEVLIKNKEHYTITTCVDFKIRFLAKSYKYTELGKDNFPTVGCETRLQRPEESHATHFSLYLNL